MTGYCNEPITEAELIRVTPPCNAISKRNASEAGIKKHQRIGRDFKKTNQRKNTDLSFYIRTEQEKVHKTLGNKETRIDTNTRKQEDKSANNTKTEEENSIYKH